jgi:glycosyltransferase involved in cell wall biosynthesis
MRTITLAITSYQRFEMLLESFAQVFNDDRISEILIVDDFSEEYIFKKLKNHIDIIGSSKIVLHRNEINLDCYFNKRRAIDLCSNEWVALIDSDNIFTKDYIDAIFAIEEWDIDTIYQPEWAMPHFDFREYTGLTFSKENIAEYIDKPMVSTLCNAMNYFVNKEKYTDVWEGTVDPHTADSILQNYNHLKSGGKIYVTPNMRYIHRIHDGSHYKINVHKTGSLYSEIENNLRNLK